jgi:hypothetical protein
MGRSRIGSLLLALVLPVLAKVDSDPGRRVQLASAPGAAVRTALVGASLRLAGTRCGGMLSEFHDRAGRSLAELSEETGVGLVEQLGRVVFADGAGQAVCRNPEVIAATSPGSRVVFVCGIRFTRLQARDPARAEAILIHELLHTLGLPENPPDSLTITETVLARCGRNKVVLGSLPQ